MNILEKANNIVNLRSEEKERQYGPFTECNRKAAAIASEMLGKEISTKDIFIFQIALKFAREAHKHKEDNLLDACAYIGALNNFYEEESDPNISSINEVPGDDVEEDKYTSLRDCIVLLETELTMIRDKMSDMGTHIVNMNMKPSSTGIKELLDIYIRAIDRTNEQIRLVLQSHE